jgi:response regulator RpfG family c-di-GMP phosphodiesterase
MIPNLHVEEIPRPSKRILVVDDYPPTRQLIIDALNQAGYYAISEAENGMEALDKCSEQHFELVISDVMMPGMGGMELLNRLRDVSADTSIIIITAHPAVELAVTAMKKGAVDFLKKPFNIDDFLLKVRIHLDENTHHKAQNKPKAGITDVQIKDKIKELSVQGYIYDSFESIEGDNESIYKKIVDLSLNVVEGEECALLLFDEEDGVFQPKIIKSSDSRNYETRTLPALKKIFQEVVTKKEALMVHSSEYPEIAPSLICAPLMIRSNIFGILCIRKKVNHALFTTKDLHYIINLTKRASLNIENQMLYESIYSNVLDTFRSLVASVQMRDHYTEEHCFRVKELSVKIARVMHCSDKEIESLKIAGILHDVGKIAIPDHILLKPGRLTTEEFEIIKTHSDEGEQILRPILLFDQERKIILHHHERWDAGGYPAGLAKTQIPLLSRILTVADSFDAMTNTRPYRPAMDQGAAVRELRDNRNRQFDGDIVDVFLTLLSQ